MSPAGSLSSMSASASPRESPGPMSPGPLAGKKGGGGGIQMQIQQLQGRTLAGFYLKMTLLWSHRKFLYNAGLTMSLWDIPIYRCSDYQYNLLISSLYYGIRHLPHYIIWLCGAFYFWPLMQTCYLELCSLSLRLGLQFRPNLQPKHFYSVLYLTYKVNVSIIFLYI